MDMHTIHETIIRDIFDVAKDVRDSDEVDRVTNFGNKTSMKSITSRAEALTMVFPVVCSRNMAFSTACMISKAIERKAVTLLQMLFSAANITDAEDGIDYISRFHTNLNTGRFSIDDFMHTMDSFVDENGLLQEGTNEYDTYKKIQEDMKAMNFYFEYGENINDVPLDSYKFVSVGENAKVLINTAEPLNEALPGFVTKGKEKDYYAFMKDVRDQQREEVNKALGKANTFQSGYQSGYSMGQRDASVENQKNHNDAMEQNAKDRLDFDKGKENTRRRENAFNNHERMLDRAETRRRNDIEADKAEWANRKAAEDILRIQADIMRNRLVDNDVKKANELVPTLMYVNFISKNDDSKYPIATSMVVGVKAKLYAVDGEDIMNRLKIKYNDKNLLLNLIKVSTREISFFKDFLFCIDKAKIDALSQSRRGSSNKIWKMLERRALKSKIKRMLNMKNDATAITTLCITQDEAEYLRKTEYIDVEDPRVIGRIMDAYNMMGFVIADDAMEICKFMFDTGDWQYEILTYDNLEREQRDNTKKILNLMSKVR